MSGGGEGELQVRGRVLNREVQRRKKQSREEERREEQRRGAERRKREVKRTEQNKRREKIGADQIRNERRRQAMRKQQQRGTFAVEVKVWVGFLSVLEVSERPVHEAAHAQQLLFAEQLTGN